MIADIMVHVMETEACKAELMMLEGKTCHFMAQL